MNETTECVHSGCTDAIAAQGKHQGAVVRRAGRGQDLCEDPPGCEPLTTSAITIAGFGIAASTVVDVSGPQE